jgi:hypothetical protein
MDKTAFSFYCDDTNPFGVPPEVFGEFLDFVSNEGIAGESSVIIAVQHAKQIEEHGFLSEPKSDLQHRYIEQLHRAYSCGMDAHMELFTHGGRFDFESRTIPEGVIHEGLWIHTAGIRAEEYEAYFENILDEGDKIGVRFTGVTWPGCGCKVCMDVYRVLDEKGENVVNPNMYAALLNLARRGRFRGRTIPCFVSEDLPGCQVKCVRADGAVGVYDLPPNLADRFAVKKNGKKVPGDPDYYISADGESGTMVESVRAGELYCMFWSHWWDLNPKTGAGWPTFKTVIERVQKHLADKIVWMRPSEITDRIHAGRTGPTRG